VNSSIDTPPLASVSNAGRAVMGWRSSAMFTPRMSSQSNHPYRRQPSPGGGLTMTEPSLRGMSTPAMTAVQLSG
jgi:hypothetical protein